MKKGTPSHPDNVRTNSPGETNLAKRMHVIPYTLRACDSSCVCHDSGRWIHLKETQPADVRTVKREIIREEIGRSPFSVTKRTGRKGGRRESARTAANRRRASLPGAQK